MYGPHIRDGKSRRQSYLIVFLDDASRLICHGEFTLSQSYEDMRKVFKEAVAKRGLSKVVYTDNGRIYSSRQFELLCASLGISLVHSEPYDPVGRGKVERFFKTVRTRFLSKFNNGDFDGLDDLNKKFNKWLDTDYQRKIHSSTGMSPLDFFMSQANSIRHLPNPTVLDEKFLIKVNRTINHDGTLNLKRHLYETDMKFATKRLEVRYDPEWLLDPAVPIFLFENDKKVGQARQVNFYDNAHAKRKGRRRVKQREDSSTRPEVEYSGSPLEETAIKYSNIMSETE